MPRVSGIIQGLSTIPYEEKIEIKMREIDIDISDLKN
jgi:hypothetical protein